MSRVSAWCSLSNQGRCEMQQRANVDDSRRLKKKKDQTACRDAAPSVRVILQRQGTAQHIRLLYRYFFFRVDGNAAASSCEGTEATTTTTQSPCSCGKSLASWFKKKYCQKYAEHGGKCVILSNNLRKQTTNRSAPWRGHLHMCACRWVWLLRHSLL